MSRPWNLLGATAVLRTISSVLDPQFGARKKSPQPASSTQAGGECSNPTSDPHMATRRNRLTKWADYVDLKSGVEKLGVENVVQAQPSQAVSRPNPIRIQLSDQALEEFRASRKNSTAQELAALAARKRSMKETDTDLAAYLMARSIQHKTIDGQELRALVKANHSVNRARKRLSHGRGNVTLDLQKSNEPLWRTLFGRRQVGDSPSLLEASAMAMRMQAGNCGEFAQVTFAVHAAKVNEGETLLLMRGNPLDHNWVEVNLPKDGRVILDAWADGPAVLGSDSAFSSDLASPLVEHTMNSTEARAFAKKVNQQWHAFALDPQVASSWKAFKEEAESTNLSLAPGDLWHPANVLHRDFLRAVNLQQQVQSEWIKKLAPDNSDQGNLENRVQLTRELRAVGAVRSMGASVRQAVQAKDDVLRTVDKMVAKPVSR